MNKVEELLVVTMEECGELIQACSKMLRGGEEYEKENLKRLLEEVGDVSCMIDLLIKKELVTSRKIEKRKLEKLQKLRQHSKILDSDED